MFDLEVIAMLKVGAGPQFWAGHYGAKFAAPQLRLLTTSELPAALERHGQLQRLVREAKGKPQTTARETTVQAGEIAPQQAAAACMGQVSCCWSRRGRVVKSFLYQPWKSILHAESNPLVDCVWRWAHVERRAALLHIVAGDDVCVLVDATLSYNNTFSLSWNLMLHLLVVDPSSSSVM